MEVDNNSDNMELDQNENTDTSSENVPSQCFQNLTSEMKVDNNSDNMELDQNENTETSFENVPSEFFQNLTSELIQNDWYNQEYAKSFQQQYISKVLEEAMLGINKKYKVDSEYPYIVVLAAFRKHSTNVKDIMTYLHRYMKIVKMNTKIEFLREKRRITFRCVDVTAANKLLDLSHLRILGWICFIPKFKCVTTVLVKQISQIDHNLSNNPIEFIKEEIMKNPNIPEVLEVKPYLSKSADAKDGIMVKIVFKGQKAPSRLKINNTEYETTLFRVQLKRCTKCQEYGHYKKSCKNEECCDRCSKQHKVCKTKNFRCANCHEKHRASDQSCRIYRQKLEIITIMQEMNLDFKKAQKFFIIYRERSSDTEDEFDIYEDDPFFDGLGLDQFLIDDFDEQFSVYDSDDEFSDGFFGQSYHVDFEMYDFSI